MRTFLLPIFCGSMLLAGCVSVGGGAAPGAELIGRRAALVTNNGQESTLHFQDGGAVRATFSGGQANGRWWVADRQLCFEWGGNERTRECWPYAQRLRPGQERTITSSRGNEVRVRLL